MDPEVNYVTCPGQGVWKQTFEICLASRTCPVHSSTCPAICPNATVPLLAPTLTNRTLRPSRLGVPRLLQTRHPNTPHIEAPPPNRQTKPLLPRSPSRNPLDELLKQCPVQRHCKAPELKGEVHPGSSPLHARGSATHDPTPRSVIASDPLLVLLVEVGGSITVIADSPPDSYSRDSSTCSEAPSPARSPNSPHSRSHGYPNRI